MTYRNEDGEQAPIPRAQHFASSLTRPTYAWYPPDLLPLAKAYLDRRKVSDEARALLPIKARPFGGFGCALGFECAPSYFYERRFNNPLERGRDYLPPGRKSYWRIDRRDSPALVLVEGVFDAIRVWEGGFSVVALHGQGVRWPEIALGLELPVIVLFDKDAVLQAELTAIEGAGLEIPCLSLSHHLVKKDPGETSPGKLRSLLVAGLRELPPRSQV